MANRWEMLELPPADSKETAALYSWSLNYDACKGPFSLFLDLIGYSQDEFGEPLYDLRDPSLGYMELDYLADALKEYTENPNQVREFVRVLLEAEAAE